ncbi:nucleoside diphosphate-linked moiety X motif 8 isoform X1 [Heterocephalus glaber]|uniref:Nucleoside diphosphate-linked moiety X motif 8 isoform X1 n=1 Tax=Heterocephalus glaber TaxID=10181 RepID=A0AAX6TCS6_HETGA|nr:nucleoside diphosphate-linked moiety X motif 8 isoform X1 [Heterocephalus glaber]
MLLESLSAEGEQRCRQLLTETTARFRSRPAMAAVLVPLCLVRGVPALLFTLRSSRLAGRHKGDVSFPGGKCDPADQDVVHTALRETQEELGLAVPKDHVWGIMRPVYDQVSHQAPGHPHRIHHSVPALAQEPEPRGQGVTHYYRLGVWRSVLDLLVGQFFIPTQPQGEVMAGGSCRQRPLWYQCLPAWASWIRRASGPIPRRWRRCLCCPWHTC